MTRPWTRPALPVTQPRRGFGGIYRSADVERDGVTLAGVPMQTASDAVVAAVELGYKVADAQLKRGHRLAKQLGGAARRAGIDSAAQPVDAAERMLSRSMLLLLEWVEGAAVDPKGPLRRLARAEYEALGAAFGLTRHKEHHDAGHKTAEPPVPAAAAAAAQSLPEAAAGRVARLVVRHEAGSALRVVRLTEASWSSAPGPEGWPLPLVFHHAATPQTPPLAATLVPLAHGGMELRVRTEAEHPSGLWAAAICDADGMQIGLVELRL
ncbi:hypothetical protein QTH87_08405 [Variovorax sp. J22P168]|uniref:hypothetical protein n=1 Tax=Variovorax jilinensis TaxID=3053513 RepID=UPI002575DEE8|nr:hypothetical protein [Variovorax sp. J22P168]MDM0012453.1 hypothetical protein [Variovorax sp. J22P168]